MTAVEATPITKEEQSKPLTLRVGAELVGSFIICFAIYAICSLGSAVYGINMAFIALLTGIVYAAVTVIFGSISGAQFNPAVSVAAMLTGKTHVLDGILYIIAQVLGGIGAGAAIRFLLPTSEQVTFKIWMTPTVNGFDKNSVSYSTLGNYGVTLGITLAIAVEVVAGIIIVASALRTTDGHGESKTNHAVAMGLAYGIGTAITYPVTGAALNPARATGIAIFAQNQGLNEEPLQQLWVFWICPVLAAAVVALVVIVAGMIGTKKNVPDTVETIDESKAIPFLAKRQLPTGTMVSRMNSPTPKPMPMKASKATDRTFHGLRSRNDSLTSPVAMAVTAIAAVAAFVYPATASTVATITTAATIHSNHGLPHDLRKRKDGSFRGLSSCLLYNNRNHNKTWRPKPIRNRTPR